MKKTPKYQKQLKAIQRSYLKPTKGMTTAQSVNNAYNQNLPDLVKAVNQKIDRMRAWYAKQGIDPNVSQSEKIRKGQHIAFNKKMSMDEKRAVYQQVNKILTDTVSYDVRKYKDYVSKSIDKLAKVELKGYRKIPTQLTDVTNLHESQMAYQISYLKDFWDIVDKLRNSDETKADWYNLYQAVKESGGADAGRDMMSGLFQFYTEGNWNPFDKITDFKQRLAELSGTPDYFESMDADDPFDWNIK